MPPQENSIRQQTRFFSLVPCCSARRTSPVFFSRKHRGSSAYPSKKGWLKGRMDLNLSRSKPCSHAGCLVEFEHCFASLPICQMGLLLHSGATGMGARQEPVGRWRISDLAAPDICAGNKKATGVGGFVRRKLHWDLKQMETTGFFVLTKAAEQRVKSLFPTVLICK